MPGGAEALASSGGASLSEDELARTVDWLASAQLPDGMLPWYRGGHADPWNHVEAAMALAAGGRRAEVEKAFEWLARKQMKDGSWCAAYVPGGVLEPHRDTNACAYVATGTLWCAEVGFGEAFLEQWWPMVERAVSWCLHQQLAGGEIAWAVDPDGVRSGWALLAANSSLYLSLRCAGAIARALGRCSRRWDSAAARVASAVASEEGRDGPLASHVLAASGGPAPGHASGLGQNPGNLDLGREARGQVPSFAKKGRWAMDWYYPVLSGALPDDVGRRRLLRRWAEFVVPGLGVRCVADRLWVTAAETAESAMAAWRVGLAGEAVQLLQYARHLRHPGGAYWTGCAHPECRRFPGGQLSTYSAAAVLIADHVVNGRSPAAKIFAGEPTL